MEKKKNLLIALLLIWVAPSFAAKVDTLLIKSPSMNKEVQVVVVTPDVASGKKSVACPTIYLLHGYGGLMLKHGLALNRIFPKLRTKKESYSFVRTERPVGTGIVRSIRLSAMKLLFRRNW